MVQTSCLFSRKLWTLSIQPKRSKNMEARANGTEISRELLNFRSAKHLTENSRNSRSKVEWKENFPENCLENWGLARLSSFWKMLFHWVMEVVENSRRTFWLNGKCPMPKKFLLAVKKNIVIYITKKENKVNSSYQNKVNSSFVSICNCKMGYLSKQKKSFTKNNP